MTHLTPEEVGGLIGQCRMQSRDSLDPKYIKFMERLIDVLSAQPKPMMVGELADAIIEYPHASPMYRAKVLHARIYGGER